MNDKGKLINSNTLQFERILSAPIDKVWSYLVDGEKRKLWFAGGATELQAGGEMKLIFHNSQLGSGTVPTPEKYKDFGEGYVSTAKVIEVNEPNKLVLEWEGVVTFELEEVGDHVKLTLTHEKLADGSQVGTLAGWHAHLTMLSDHLSEKESMAFWTLHNQLETEYANVVG